MVAMMQPLDVNRLFARAEQAFVAGRLDSARDDLAAVERLAGGHPQVLHLLALVEKKAGREAAARAAFERALALAPNDPDLLNNFANLLAGTGDLEEAVRLYGRALAGRPGHVDARYNRALLLQQLGRPEEALADLDMIRSAGQAGAKLHSARGAVLRELGRVDEAAEAFDLALSLEPGRLTALHGRARIAMERGEDGASAWYRRALQQAPDDLALALGLAEALEAEGDDGSVPLLSELVERHPGWVEGHEVLARMRSEAGEPQSFADHYRRSLERRPNDRALHYSYWTSLARGGLHGQALQALRDARLSDEPELRVMEAVFTSEAGDPAAALALLDRAGLDQGRPDLIFARGRIGLRAGDPQLAARMFQSLVEADPGSINGWAHLDLAWRLLGDPRHEWLSGQPGLYGHREVGLDEVELSRLADLLRTLHRTRSHPIGQSLRGGTQTRGRLFSRGEPEIARLLAAIKAAVRAHLDQLPAADPRHPLLKYRGGEPAITGSWSVRLASQGFHVNHIHPEGVLSSACYISLPAGMNATGEREGWLELGRPPSELGLELEPLAVVEPQPGRLALFPSYLFHGTRPFASGERLTVAFDVVVKA